ncbi:MAG TPA: hypothetical protein VG871_04420 [Vicinamibacterales bacterium]|nr:hypothetical protein [Vicinamibacterales bacterium]
MPWYCPGCRTEIRLADDGAHDPHYRCEVCRLEMVVDGTSNRTLVSTADDQEMTERPHFDRRDARRQDPPADGDRRRRQRRRQETIH